MRCRPPVGRLVKLERDFVHGQRQPTNRNGTRLPGSRSTTVRRGRRGLPGRAFASSYLQPGLRTALDRLARGNQPAVEEHLFGPGDVRHQYHPLLARRICQTERKLLSTPGGLGNLGGGRHVQPPLAFSQDYRGGIFVAPGQFEHVADDLPGRENPGALLAVDGADIVGPEGHVLAVEVLLVNCAADDLLGDLSPGIALIVLVQFQQRVGISQTVPLNGAGQTTSPDTKWPRTRGCWHPRGTASRNRSRDR